MNQQLSTYNQIRRNRDLGVARLAHHQGHAMEWDQDLQATRYKMKLSIHKPPGMDARARLLLLFVSSGQMSEKNPRISKDSM